MSHPSPMRDEDRKAIAARWNAHPGLTSLGARVAMGEDHEVRAWIDAIEPRHCGGLGTDAVNGATIASLFDLVIGLAGYQFTLGRRAGVAQLNIQYLRPVLGKRVEVIGRPQRAGRTLVFASAELVDERGVVCARCDGIVAVAGGGAEPDARDPAF